VGQLSMQITSTTGSIFDANLQSIAPLSSGWQLAHERVLSPESRVSLNKRSPSATRLGSSATLRGRGVMGSVACSADARGAGEGNTVDCVTASSGHKNNDCPEQRPGVQSPYCSRTATASPHSRLPIHR
jgi:hypothetical protein